MFTLAKHTGRLARIGLIIMVVGLLSSYMITYAQEPSITTPAQNPPTQPLELNAPQGLSTLPISCGSRQDNWFTTTISPTFLPIVSCSLIAPKDGVVFINATASLVYNTDNVKAVFRLGIDNNPTRLETGRLVNVYTDTAYLSNFTNGDGSDKSVAASGYFPITAGPHTFYFVGARATNVGTIQLADPSITALFIPSPTDPITPETMTTCGGSFGGMWVTTSNTVVPIRVCSVVVPSSGYLYVHATASLALSDNPYEARFRIKATNGITTTGIPDSDRRIDMLRDSTGAGMNESIATSGMVMVNSGTYTVTFEGFRSSTNGTVSVVNPTLAAIFIPSNIDYANACIGTGGPDLWSNNTSTFSVVRSCSVNITRPMFALVDASAHATINPNVDSLRRSWEGQFRIGVNNSSGSADYNRFVNIYANSDPVRENDRIVADNGAFFLQPGNHTFYFTGRKFSGDGIATLERSSLSVILIPTNTLYLPLILYNSTP